MIIPTPSSYRPSLDDFRKASNRIKGTAMHTPLIPLRYYDENPEILLKPEMLQPIGSYKIRGVYNWVAKLSPEQRAKGISTVSTGNMAQALAYVAKIYGIPARAIVQHTSPQNKKDAIRKYGGEVVPKSYEEWVDYVSHPEPDRSFLNPVDEYGLLDGHGTIGLEIIEDAPDTETIFVPLGAGFLGAGVSLAAKILNPDVKIIGVNAENSPHFYMGLKQGKPMDIPTKPTLADGTTGNLVEYPNALDNLRLIQETMDEIVLVSEDQIKDAIRYLALENKLVAEGSGAMSLAAALSTSKSKRGKTVCILSGGSIDADKLTKIISH